MGEQTNEAHGNDRDGVRAARDGNLVEKRYEWLCHWQRGIKIRGRGSQALFNFLGR